MGYNDMQDGLYLNQRLVVKYGISTTAGLLLDYCGKKAKWAYMDTSLQNGDIYVPLSFKFDILVKTPGMGIKSKSSYRRIIKELEEAGLIFTIYKGNHLYLRLLIDLEAEAKTTCNVTDNQTNDVRYAYESKMSSETYDKWISFWSLYGKLNNKGRKSACIVFQKCIDYYDDIMIALPLYIRDQKEQEWKNPKLAEKWLEEHRWEDYAKEIMRKKNIDPVELFIRKCETSSNYLFNQKAYASKEQYNAIDLYEFTMDSNTRYFSDQEIKLIGEYGGFGNIVWDKYNEGFSSKIRELLDRK